MQEQNGTEKIKWYSYVIFIFAFLFFSGIFTNTKDWTQALDFSVLNGSFGKIIGEGGTAYSFRGTDGGGAKDGFLFALELIPAVIFSLGFVSVVEGLGGLKVAQKLMTPLLRPMLGVPGICGLALISNLQSTDAGAGMTRDLVESGDITDEERTIFSTYQTSGSATITNYFGSGAALFTFIKVPILLPFIVIFLFKVVSANMMRLYIQYDRKKNNEL